MVKDQAENLRMRIHHEKERSGHAKIIGVASGKGGVGKSVFTVNFAVALQEMGKRVLIIDLDVGMGNIEQIIGTPAKSHIAETLQHKIYFHDAVTKVMPDLSFIAGGTGLSSLFHLNRDYLQNFLEQLDLIKKEYDYILFDFGAGASEDMLHFMLAVNRLILITTPEPTAMADSYSLVKMVYALKGDLPVSCVVNQVLDRHEGMEAWQRLSTVAGRFLGTAPEWLAALPREREVLMSVRKQKPCMMSYPKAGYCVNMRILARAFLVRCGEQVKAKTSLSFGEKVRKYLRLIRSN